MIISHEHRYVFVQVPDTASSAIGKELCARYKGEEILQKHSHLAELAASAHGNDRNYFVFGTIRNPLEIMVARYFKLTVNRYGIFTDPEAWAENGGHVTQGQRERFRFIQETDADFPAFFREFVPRLYTSPYFTGISDRFDMVLRHERLDQDFRVALSRVGICAERDIPKYNVTPVKKRPFSDYYTPEIIDRAVSSFGPFMRSWGHDFPPSWGNRRPPRKAVLEYEVGDKVGRFCAGRLGWNPERSLRARDNARRWVRRTMR